MSSRNRKTRPAQVTDITEISKPEPERYIHANQKSLATTYASKEIRQMKKTKKEMRHVLWILLIEKPDIGMSCNPNN